MLCIDNTWQNFQQLLERPPSVSIPLNYWDIDSNSDPQIPPSPSPGTPEMCCSYQMIYVRVFSLQKQDIIYFAFHCIL